MLVYGNGRGSQKALTSDSGIELQNVMAIIFKLKKKILENSFGLQFGVNNLYEEFFTEKLRILTNKKFFDAG